MIPVTELTATKQRDIAKMLNRDMADRQVMPWERIVEVSQTASTPADLVQRIAEGLGYLVNRPQREAAEPRGNGGAGGAPSKRLGAPGAVPGVPVEVQRAIARGLIYRTLDDGLTDDAPVMTSYGLWQRERAAIRAWIIALGGEWPD